MTPEERRARTLAKYARYNASEKGKQRVDTYRSTIKGIFTRARCALNQRIAAHQAVQS